MLRATYDGGRHAPLRDRLISAAVRRLSLIPALCEISQPRKGVHCVTCSESGSWVEYDTTGWRIRRIGECEMDED